MRGFCIGAAAALMLALAGCTSDALVGVVTGVYLNPPSADGSRPTDGALTCDQLRSEAATARATAMGLQSEASEIQRGLRPSTSSAYQGMTTAPQRAEMAALFNRRIERLATRQRALNCPA